MESTLTLKFRGLEAKVLEEFVRLGLFNTKSEAVRAAIVKYAIDSGLLAREELWEGVRSYKRRKVSAKSLAKELQKIEKR